MTRAAAAPEIFQNIDLGLRPDWHRVANGITIENDGAIITNDAGQKLCNGLIGAHFADLHLAGDGIAALEFWREGGFDMIILDVMLPGKVQFTCRNTVPGPGRSSATTALRIALVMPPWTTMAPNGVARATFSS